MSLIESKMANAAGRMAELLATDMYLDGQGTNSSIIAVDGLQGSIDDGKNVAVVKFGYMLETQRIPGYVNSSRDNASVAGDQQGRPDFWEPSETNMPNSKFGVSSLEKIESELHGDMQKLAEMSSSVARALAPPVTTLTNFPSYGGITRSDIATGANLGINAYYSNIAGNLSLGALQTAYGACWFGPERPDLLATDQATWNVIWNKLQPQQRFNEESSDVAKTGFQVLRFNGSSLTVDMYIPAGTVYGMNTNYIDLYVTTEKKYQFGFTGLTIDDSINKLRRRISGRNDSLWSRTPVNRQQPPLEVSL